MPRLLPALLALALSLPASAQWTNRYPAVPGYSHHVYLEGYELPTFAAGVTDPAPSPDGRSVAFASKGWLWVMDLEARRARRVTSGAEVDARPAWSPDGRRLAFVRDDTEETWIVVLDLESGEERVVADAEGLELDPTFVDGGDGLVYAAASPTGIDLRHVALETDVAEWLTEAPGLALAPVAHPDGGLVYVSKYRGDEVRYLEPGTAEGRAVRRGAILSQTRPAISPDGRTLALTLPLDDGWELVLEGLEAPGPTVRLLEAAAPPLDPAFSADGAHVYYAQADAAERVRLMRVPAEGGTPEEVAVEAWDWGAELGTVTVTTRVDGEVGPARVAVTTADGHPLVPDDRQAWFDGENGVVYVFSDGEVTLRAPAGGVRVTAVQGLATPAATAEVGLEAGERAAVTLDLERVWDAPGWLSGDQHFHLNYGGPYALDPGDLDPLLAGEGLDVASPLVANLHTRYVDDELWGQDATDALPYRAFGQEVRSHFFGHVGLVGLDSLFHPWIWGPGYEVFGRDDRENATAIAHARRQGGLGTYVHPVSDRDPFADGAGRYVPVSLVADGVLGDLDGIEVVCLWTDDLGTARLWYRLLSLGRTVVPMAGSDVMSNFYRTMAPGTARAVVEAGEGASYEAYLEALGAGRSFVTTGPFLVAEVGGARPGGVVGAGRAAWSAEVASAVPFERLEVVVNGEVVATEAGLEAPGRRAYSGEVDLPEGGWVAVRAWGEEATGWPSMAAYPFAHTAPVWIGAVGSVDPVAQRRAARELLGILDQSEAVFEAAYGGLEAPRLRTRFARARAKLERLAE